VRELIEERGARLVYPPACPPDLNLIEETFSRIERLVGKAGARTRASLRLEGAGSTGWAAWQPAGTLQGDREDRA
jgi:transposase